MEENFVKMMNAKSRLLGMMDKTFSNPHGLDDDTENYSTAYDLALISRYAKTNDSLAKIMATKSITVNFGKTPKYLANTNRLLSTYVYCDGGKTGFTNMANRCLVATAKKDDLRIYEKELREDKDEFIITKEENMIYGKSITDPCIGWEDTERLLYKIADEA